MASRSTGGRNVGRDQDPDRQAGTERQGSTTGTGAAGSAGGGTTDRERTVPTGRDVARRPSDRSGVPGRGGGTMAPWSGPVSSPFAMMRRMMDDMDRLFDEFAFGRPFGEPGRGGALSPWSGIGSFDVPGRGPASRGAGALWAPQVEVFERGNQIVVRADLPGLTKDDVNVEVENGVLTVSGERQQDYEDTGEGYVRSERSYGAFARSIPLPEGVNEEQVNATFKDGVLEVTLPRPEGEQSRRRRIDIR